jgi:curved DNA-binding protein CbpA
MSRTPLPTIPKPAGNQDEDIAAEHHQRMEKDYYAFLGLPSTASAEELRDVSRAMAQRMNALSRSPSLSQETRLLVQDMLSGVQRAYGTFTDRKRKEDYDRQIVDGGAATIQPLPSSAVPPQDVKRRGFDIESKDQADDGWSFLKMGKKP